MARVTEFYRDKKKSQEKADNSKIRNKDRTRSKKIVQNIKCYSERFNESEVIVACSSHRTC